MNFDVNPAIRRIDEEPAEVDTEKAKPAALVELMTPRSAELPECRIELEGRHGVSTGPR